jgi:hypothetical protein
MACLVFSCDNNNKDSKSAAAKTADSLFNIVMDGHDAGMGKMGRLTRAEQMSRRLLDSIQKLPAKTRRAAEPMRVKLDSLQKELSYAEFAMNKWMNEFNMDSALNNLDKRIDYLKSEKIKVSNVKEAILESIQKADSVLHKKF